MKKTLKEFLAKGKRPKAVAFAFGRMNPPTAGHEKLIQKVEAIARRIKGDGIIYVSASQDRTKNPLDARTKIKYLQPLYRNIKFVAAGGNTRTFMEVLKNALDRKYSDVYMIAGSDRVSEFKRLITQYNGKDFNFDKTEVVSAGERDPDAQGTSGISGTKMRLYAVRGDYNSFRRGLPVKMKDADGKKLFKDLRTAMGIKSQKGFGVQMKPIMSLEDFEKQELRQEYIEENIFEIGDYVENMNDCSIGKIIKRGTNYLVYEMEDGGVKKAWLHECCAVDDAQIEMMESTDVQKEKVKDVVLQKNSDALDDDDDDYLEDVKVKQDPDVDDKPGTQPKKYYKGVSKKTKDKRAAHFKKGAKMDDDNPNAYKPAPGDKDAKTKPSTYTKQFKKMYGEVNESRPGLWANIHKKRKEGRPMRKKGEKGAPTQQQIKRAQGEAVEIGKDYADHAKKITPKEKANKFAMAPHMGKFDPVEYGIHLKDIKEWAESEATIAKYQKRYGDTWEEQLGKVVNKMMEKTQKAMSEKLDALQKKADKSGISYGTLKKVYDRGMAAWKTGHRPGTTPQQWGYARVNAFIVKRKKGNLNHDKDLA